MLFLQKFTAKEQADFDAKHLKANREVKATHADAIAKETARLEAAIAAATEAHDAGKRKALQKELRNYQKGMDDTIATETRALLKERFPYPSIPIRGGRSASQPRATLTRTSFFPNDRQPGDMSKTCLEIFREFQHDPQAFFLTESPQ